MTAVLTYDNPATMRRECWQDGELLCCYAASVLRPGVEIPGEYFFFGANIGPWATGQARGDSAAMDPEAPGAEQLRQQLAALP